MIDASFDRRDDDTSNTGIYCLARDYRMLVPKSILMPIPCRFPWESTLSTALGSGYVFEYWCWLPSTIGA